MYERRGPEYVRRFSLLLVSIALGSSCFLPPDPPIPEDETEEPEMIRGAWKPVAPTGTGTTGEGSEGVRRVIAPPQWDAGSAILEGHWSAEVLPLGSEAMPEVSLSLFESAPEGDVVGTATYSFPDYACHYALVLESMVGPTVELSQRWGVGPCAEAGRIVLQWGDDEDLVGDWRRADGSRWFRVRLSPRRAVDAEGESGSTSRRGSAWPGGEPGGK